MKIHAARLVALALLGVSFLTAQAVDNTELKQVIIFGVAPGILTAKGAALETILGGYLRLPFGGFYAACESRD